MTEQNTHAKAKETTVAPEENAAEQKKFKSLVLPAALVGSIVLVGFLVAALYFT